MMSLGSGLRNLGLFIPLLCFSGVNARAEPYWLELPLKTDRLVKQGYKECGPTSVFNALISADDKYQSRMQLLTGTTPEAKYQDFLHLFARKISLVTDGPRLNPNIGGTSREDMYWIFRDLVPSKPLRANLALRKPGESAGQLAARVRKMILDSLKAGLPPVLEINRVEAGYYGKLGPGQTELGEKSIYTLRYSEIPTGHFVMVYGIALQSGDQIILKIFNPYFRQEEISAFEDLSFQNAPAYLENYVSENFAFEHETTAPKRRYQDVSQTVSRPVRTAEGTLVESPYLRITSSTFSISEAPADTVNDPVNTWPDGSLNSYYKNLPQLGPNQPKFYYILKSLIGAK